MELDSRLACVFAFGRRLGRRSLPAAERQTANLNIKFCMAAAVARLLGVDIDVVDFDSEFTNLTSMLLLLLRKSLGASCGREHRAAGSRNCGQLWAPEFGGWGAQSERADEAKRQGRADINRIDSPL